MIKLRFIEESGLFPWAIKLREWGFVTHVEFCVPGGYLAASNAKPSGVAIRPLDYCQPKKEWFGIVDCDEMVAHSVLTFAKAQIGKPYHWLGVLGFVVEHDWNNEKSWFCSQLIVAAFEQAGYPIAKGEKADRFTPQDVFNSPLVRILT